MRRSLGGAGSCLETSPACASMSMRSTRSGSPNSAANAVVCFDPATETFADIPVPTAPGEVGAESGTGRLVVIDTETGS